MREPLMVTGEGFNGQAVFMSPKWQCQRNTKHWPQPVTWPHPQPGLVLEAALSFFVPKLFVEMYILVTDFIVMLCYVKLVTEVIIMYVCIPWFFSLVYLCSLTTWPNLL